MEDTQFGSPLPIAHVMWYFDTHLHHLKQTPGFTAAAAFIYHQPDLACTIASIEPDSCMYLLGVSTDSVSNLINKVHNQLNHVLTQGSKLDESGDLDQPANWKNRGIPLSVWDEKYGSDTCELKEKEIVQKGQAAAAKAPAAKRKSTGEEPDPKKKKTASKPEAVKSVANGLTDESYGDEEKESEEDDQEEAQVSQGKTANKQAVRPTAPPAVDCMETKKWKNTQKEKHSLHSPVHLHFSVRAEPSPLLTTSLGATNSSPKSTNQSTPRNDQSHLFRFTRQTASVIYSVLQVVYIFSEVFLWGTSAPEQVDAVKNIQKNRQ